MIFITLEGLDGSGKTTISKLLKNWFLNHDYDVVLTREPGGIGVAEDIRRVILDDKNKIMTPWTETLLYIAARKQHLEEYIIPCLKKNIIVICDRFSDSTSAYQGYARGISIDQINKIQDIVLGTYKPNLTLYFDINPTESLKRIKSRTEKQNRFDKEDAYFHKKVYEGYKTLIKQNRDRIKVVNAKKSINEVYEECISIIKKMV